MTAGSLTGTVSGSEAREGFAWAQALRLLGLTAQLGLSILVIREFALEGSAFYHMMLLATAGFLVNALLPMHFRQAWFILVSLIGIGLLFGVADTVWLVAVGLVLIGLCHLPVSWILRVVLIVAVGAGLALSRAGWFAMPFSLGVWPILGSMFMFRLMVYLHHIKHNPTKVSAGRALAYFFMLPNTVFPLFPVVDYKTFDATYYDQDAFAIYQAGLRYIARGLFHLVVYRYVYYYIAQDPSELVNLGDLLLYVTSTFLIYVRVSGQFHIIVGVLHLFGYRLPTSNFLYFLATGFTEIWRRNNIYWKDFMMKLVYFPSYFKLRQRGGTFALIVATILVFSITWALHSYQWFWIRGEFPITATDLLFWGSVGLFMMIEMVRDARRGPAKRAPERRNWSLARAVKTVAFFALFSALWALWDSQSVADFFSIWRVGATYDTRTLLMFGAITLAALAIAGWPWGQTNLAASQERQPLWRRTDVQTVGTLAGLLVFAQPSLTNLVSPSVTTFAQSLRESRLNARDAASEHRGYYEQLNTSRNAGRGELEDVNEERPADWVPLTETEVYRGVKSFLGGELVPGTSVDFKGSILSVNHLGMRDREYGREHPDGTIRFALVGPSDVMGAGVADSQTFESLLEERLNRELSPGTGKRYEVLNFGVVSYSILQQAQMVEERALDFHPDVIVVSYHPISEARFAFQYLANQVRFGNEVPHAELRAIAAEAGIKRGMEQPDAFRRMKPYGHRLVRWSLARIDSLARARGARAILYVRDMPAEQSERADSMITYAAGAGYTILDIRGVFGDVNPDSLKIASWDKHPNARGHRMIADRLFAEIQKNDSLDFVTRPAGSK